MEYLFLKIETLKVMKNKKYIYIYIFKKLPFSMKRQHVPENLSREKFFIASKLVVFTF